MPDHERIYQNTHPKPSKVKIPKGWREPGLGVSHRHDNYHSTSHLESKSTNHRCTRTNMLMISLCVSLLCGITVLAVLYAIKDNTQQQQSNTGQCSGGWELFNGSCYYFSHDALNWTASRDACVSAGGHLAVIDSTEEQIYITQTIKDTEDGFWIGLTDSEREGHWQWVDSKMLRLKFWYQGQPNNNNQHGEGDKNGAGEDCGLVRHVSQEQNWYDERCGASESRICEAKPK